MNASACARPASDAVEMSATAVKSKKRYAVFAPRARLQAEALALRELLMNQGLTAIEKSFPEAEWRAIDGTDADNLDTQLVVTINQVRFTGYPDGGVEKVVTDDYAVSWLESDLEPGAIPTLACDVALTPLLKRVASGTSTMADAQELSQQLRRAA